VPEVTAADERPRLYELRTEQGWTQQEVVDRMARLVWARDGKPIGVTTDMYSKWERGAKGVSPRYRTLLACVFKVSVDRLGLPGLARGQSDRRDDQSLVAVLDQAAELLDLIGDAARAVRPQVLAALTDDVLSRRTMLTVLDAPMSARTPPTPDELDKLADQYKAAHGIAAPTALMTMLTAHLRMVGDALTRDPSTGARQRLLKNRARVALLAGQLAVGDLANSMAARAYYSQAMDDAYETDDRSLIVAACQGSARLALAEGQTVAASRHQAVHGHLATRGA
jgi:transcriptional regulator with XRE-family HTH domain